MFIQPVLTFLKNKQVEANCLLRVCIYDALPLGGSNKTFKDMCVSLTVNLMEMTKNLFCIALSMWKYEELKHCGGFSGGWEGKESACSEGDPGWIPGSGRSPGGGRGNLLSILAWRIPWTKEPGGLQFMGSQRVGHYWSANILTFSRHCGCNRVFCMENFRVNISHFICMELLSQVFSFKRVLTFEILEVRLKILKWSKESF